MSDRHHPPLQLRHKSPSHPQHWTPTPSAPLILLCQIGNVQISDASFSFYNLLLLFDASASFPHHSLHKAKTWWWNHASTFWFLHPWRIVRIMMHLRIDPPPPQEQGRVQLKTTLPYQWYWYQQSFSFDTLFSSPCSMSCFIPLLVLSVFPFYPSAFLSDVSLHFQTFWWHLGTLNLKI